jgi:glycerophosphoryl diester phosphodiesterase
MKAKHLNLLLAFTLFVTGCEKIEPDRIRNLNNGKILVVGHGGGGFQSYFNPLPANSLLSISRAIDVLLADGVEVDAQLSADKKLVLYHDEFLENQTSCSGCITGQTAEEVLKCRYNRNAGNNLKEREPLITLETVMAKLAAYKVKPQLFIDTKLLNACNANQVPQIPDFAEAVAALVAQYNAYAWTHIESNSVPLLLTLKARDSRFRLSYYTRNPAADIPVMARLGFEGITVFNHEITARQVSQAHQQGLSVTILGIKSRSGLLNTISKSPDAIQTDNIPLLINILQD